MDLRALACAFRPDNAPALAVGNSVNANEEVRRLLSAATLLEGSSGQQLEGTQAMEALLRQRPPEADWSATHYAALAARISLSHGESERTGRLLELGLKHAPEDEELHYLARILQREQAQTPNLSATRGQ